MVTCHQDCCQGSHMAYTEPVLLPQRSSRWQLSPISEGRWSRAGRCMCNPQKLPEKLALLTACVQSFRRSLSLELLGSAIAGGERSCTGPEPGLAAASVPGLVLRMVQCSVTPAASNFCSCISTRDVARAACTRVNPPRIICAQARGADQRSSSASCAERPHESLAVLNQIQEI